MNSALTPPHRTGNNSYHFSKIKVSQVCFKDPGLLFRVVGPACVDPGRIPTSLFRGSGRDSKSLQGLGEEEILRECGLTFLPKVETWFQREKSGGSGGLPGVGVRWRCGLPRVPGRSPAGLSAPHRHWSGLWSAAPALWGCSWGEKAAQCWTPKS